MTEKERSRLSNRIIVCQNEIELAMKRMRLNATDLKFWRNELIAAEAEFHGYKQGELKFATCSSCGD